MEKVPLKIKKRFVRGLSRDLASDDDYGVD